MAYEYSISREQYKKIKKMDHRQLDEFIVNYGKNLIHYDDSKNIVKQSDEEKEINKNTSDKISDTTKIIEDTKAMCYEAMVIAIENTKGIGEKIKANFIAEYEKAN